MSSRESANAILVVGSERVSPDSKGRITIPPEFAAHLIRATAAKDAREVVVTRGWVSEHRRPYLEIHSVDGWLVRIRNLVRRAQLNDLPAYQRYYINPARRCPLDASNRLVIPSNQRGVLLLDAIEPTVELADESAPRSRIGKLRRPIRREDVLVLIGQGDHLELYREVDFEAETAAVQAGIEPPDKYLTAAPSEMEMRLDLSEQLTEAFERQRPTKESDS